MGNGLSLVSVQDLNRWKDQERSSSVKKPEAFYVKSSVSQQQQQRDDETNSIFSNYEPNDQERLLIDKLWDNRLRIQMQHQQLMLKAARFIRFPSTDKNMEHSDLSPVKCIAY